MQRLGFQAYRDMLSYLPLARNEGVENKMETTVALGIIWGYFRDPLHCSLGGLGRRLDLGFVLGGHGVITTFLCWRIKWNTTWKMKCKVVFIVMRWAKEKLAGIACA